MSLIASSAWLLDCRPFGGVYDAWVDRGCRFHRHLPLAHRLGGALMWINTVDAKATRYMLRVLVAYTAVVAGSFGFALGFTLAVLIDPL